jgi:hypothetical protein
VNARVASFNQAFLNGNYPAVIDAIPPKILEAAARQGRVNPKKMRSTMISLTREITKSVRVLSFGMATDRATYGQTSTGKTYALIPTQTVIETPAGQKLQSNNTTLALQEGDTWYLVRIDESIQDKMLKQAYPEFSNLRVPRGTTKPL